MQAQTKHIEIHVEQPKSKFEHVEVFLGILVALITIGGFIWKMRGKTNDERRTED